MQLPRLPFTIPWPRAANGRASAAIAREAIQGDPTYSGTGDDRGRAYEDRIFRRLSGWSSVRTPSPTDHTALQREAWEAYQDNPLAYAVVELGVDFVVGSGIRLRANNPRVQSILDRFWHDPDNRMDERLSELYKDLSLHGELFIRLYPDQISGRLAIRSIDPLRVSAIETDPEDVETPRAYLLTNGVTTTTTIAGSEILSWKINVLPYVLRGRSDLATLLPWVRRYKDWLTDRARINRYKAAFLYDVKMDGASTAELQAKRAEWAEPPEPGTVVFHNQAETWTAVNPNIGADDVSADGRAFRMMVAVGGRVPEHYLAEGSQVTRATAQEMGLPTLRHFRRRQDLLKAIVGRLAEAAIAAHRAATGYPGPRIDTGFHVEFDELQELDRRAAGQMAAMFANALAIAEDRGWVDSPAARELFYRFLGEEIGKVSDTDRAPSAATTAPESPPEPPAAEG